MTDFVAGSPGYAIELQNVKLLNLFLQRELELQKLRLNGDGLTVFTYIGGTTGPSSGGKLTYDVVEQPIATGSSFDYKTDINVWSRGSVSTGGVVTPNSTSIIFGGAGIGVLTLAPGESITLRSKNPTKLFFHAGKATAATDSVIFYW